MSEASRRGRTTLEGRIIRIEPVDPAKHAQDLYEGSHGPERETIWRYLWDAPFASAADFRANLEKKAASEDPLYFAIVNRETGKPVGYAAHLRIDVPNRVMEVGSILFTPPFRRHRGDVPDGPACLRRPGLPQV
jgi:RimJ/RimL family protein N-acetyltransferase